MDVAPETLPDGLPGYSCGQASPESAPYRSRLYWKMQRQHAAYPNERPWVSEPINGRRSRNTMTLWRSEKQERSPASRAARLPIRGSSTKPGTDDHYLQPSRTLPGQVPPRCAWIC